MKVSKTGLLFSGIYVLGTLYLIFTQGLFGESFIALTVGLPWSFLVVAVSYFDISISHPLIYAIVVGPLLINVALLYWIGSRFARWSDMKNIPLAAAILFLAVGGFLIWQDHTPAPPAVDWATYHNDEYGFEFKYPPTSEIRKADDGADLSLFINDPAHPTQGGYGYLSIDVEDIEADNLPANPPSEGYVRDHKGYRFSFSVDSKNGENLSDTANAILDSLKFF